MGKSREDVDNVNGSLVERTIELLNKTELTLPEVYRETGVPFYWLRKFKQRDVIFPSANRVQVLYEFLSGKKLVVR